MLIFVKQRTYSFDIPGKFVFRLKGSEFEENSLHCCLEYIRNWRTGLKFLISSRIIKCFELDNKNRLKNIVKKFLNEPSLGVRISLFIGNYD